MTTQTTQPPSTVRHHGQRDLRAMVGMTAATLALLGGVALWHMHSGGAATTATTQIRTQGMVVGQQATLVPVSDATMYQQWLDRAAAALVPVEPTAVSDQEMFGQWQQRPTLATER